MTQSDTNPLLGFWLAKLDMAEKSQQAYRERVKKIIRRYRDERSDQDRSSRLNILWSNIETLKPALYSSTPKPQIERRYKDGDPFARQSAMVLERALATNMDLMDFDNVMRDCVQDYLLTGRAVARIRYIPEIVKIFDESDDLEKTDEKLIHEQVVCDYVHWNDFLHDPARNWNDVTWVAFRNYLCRDELSDRFGESAVDIGLDVRDDLHDGDKVQDWNDKNAKATVWEIWDKSSANVLWIAPNPSTGRAKLLEIQSDPMHLSGFFPCPSPLMATTTSDDLTPVPDYALYQDQAIELDILTARISALARMIRLRGVYDASVEPVQRLLSEYGGDSQLIPVDQWAALTQKGGLDSIVAWMPIERMVQVLRELYQIRDRVKNDLYEITGIADVIRGATAPSETATAQQIKGRFATLRLSERQKSVARFGRDLIRLMAEVMAEHFNPETLSNMTGMNVVPEMVQLFQSEQIRNWRIDIESDSTVAVDEAVEKQTRIEFLNAVTGFIKEITPLVQSGAVPLDIAKAMLLFGVRGFKVGSELESALETLGNGAR